LDIENVELYDDNKRICVDWELDRAREAGFAPVETIEE